jgi:hypothetical protein
LDNPLRQTLFSVLDKGREALRMLPSQTYTYRPIAANEDGSEVKMPMIGHERKTFDGARAGHPSISRSSSCWMLQIMLSKSLEAGPIN